MGSTSSAEAQSKPSSSCSTTYVVLLGRNATCVWLVPMPRWWWRRREGTLLVAKVMVQAGKG